MLEHSPSLLPKLPPHRPSATTKVVYQDKVAAFCATILELRSRLDFAVGSRGWAYLLEGERFIDKDEIDAAQALINACRKSGELPLDICSEDDKRVAENVEEIDPGPEETASSIFNYVQTAEDHYTPFSFWDDLNTYVQAGVEKSNIKNLFAKTCAGLYVPIANLSGWADLNVRAGFMRRFAEKEAEGKQCVLLVFTDLDPGGLNINNFLRSNLEELAHAVRWSPDNLIIERFGLDYEFVEREQLTWIENLATSKGEYRLDDKRHPDHLKPYVQEYLLRTREGCRILRRYHPAVDRHASVRGAGHRRRQPEICSQCGQVITPKGLRPPPIKARIFDAVKHRPGITAQQLRDWVWADDMNGGPLTDTKCLHVHVVQLNALLRPLGIMVRSQGGGYQIRDVK